MCIAATLVDDEVSSVSGFAIYADARLGGNGDAWGTPEQVVGQDEYNAEYDRVTWDGDLEDGFDSGYVSDALIVSSDIANDTVFADHQINSDSTTFTSTSIGYIGKVQFRAFTQAAAVVEWRNISVRFYQGNDLVDSYALQNGPSVDTTTSENTSAEEILEITPQGTGIDRVEIWGMFRMTFDSPNLYPGPTDLGAQIFVFSATE
jgi:hypothetical protein